MLTPYTLLSATCPLVVTDDKSLLLAKKTVKCHWNAKLVLLDKDCKVQFGMRLSSFDLDFLNDICTL